MCPSTELASLGSYRGTSEEIVDLQPQFNSFALLVTVHKSIQMCMLILDAGVFYLSCLCLVWNLERLKMPCSKSSWVVMMVIRVYI